VTALWPTKGQPYIGVAVLAEERSLVFSEFGNRVKALRQINGALARFFFAAHERGISDRETRLHSCHCAVAGRKHSCVALKPPRDIAAKERIPPRSRSLTAAAPVPIDAK
jgi:hypothetical protein